MVNDLIAAVARAEVGFALAPDEKHLWICDREDHEAEDQAWVQFQTMLRSGSRYFNDEALNFLNDLFAVLGKLSAGGLVKEVKPQTVLEVGRRLYRARRANSQEEFLPIVHDLARQLHAPPPNRTPANRMNAERSPAFYAALDFETAVAETRPSIGSRVVVGEFQVTRALKVVDFRVLSRSKGAWFSIWEPNYRKRAVMRGLLRKLQERIARPIPAGAEHEYLETQVVADYLYSCGKYDAILFESSQANGGTNVVIFNGALGKYSDDARLYTNAPVQYVENSAKVHEIESMKITQRMKQALSY
ncbi:RES family NAD+ phosphorylase [Variovorax gossypii]